MSLRHRIDNLERIAPPRPETEPLAAEIAAALVLPTEAERDAALLRLEPVARGRDMNRLVEGRSDEALARLYWERVGSLLPGCDVEPSEGKREP